MYTHYLKYSWLLFKLSQDIFPTQIRDTENYLISQLNLTLVSNWTFDISLSMSVITPKFEPLSVFHGVMKIIWDHRPNFHTEFLLWSPSKRTDVITKREFSYWPDFPILHTPLCCSATRVNWSPSSQGFAFPACSERGGNSRNIRLLNSNVEEKQEL